ncbi:50S ribosomal protein L6 [Candidatus Bathyarchaeota archaeon ex4484_205]|nr:MAG: 50S ribosomal protein L6 [Candidatus Bathyarchaeota archaeon ex4484_205]RLG67401.1 MAG: 50S ribosomal protein L6 [archaeon]
MSTEQEVGWKRSVEIPDDIELEVEGLKVRVKGPLGSLERDFSHAPISLIKENNVISVVSTIKGRRGKSIVGTIVKHIRNMIRGVKEGYYCKLIMVQSHFPMNVKVVRDKILIENFIGERAPRVARIMSPDIEVKVEGEEITIKGIDIEKVTQTAANLELATVIKGKDTRIFLDGIYVVEKGFGGNGSS